MGTDMPWMLASFPFLIPFLFWEMSCLPPREHWVEVANETRTAPSAFEEKLVRRWIKNVIYVTLDADEEDRSVFHFCIFSGYLEVQSSLSHPRLWCPNGGETGCSCTDRVFAKLA